MEDSVAAAAVVVTPIEYGIEVSQTSRASCKHCKQKIMKGEVVFFIDILLTSYSLNPNVVKHLLAFNPFLFGFLGFKFKPRPKKVYMLL